MSLGEWFLAEWAGDARELAMSLKTRHSLPPAAELKGHSRDRDETVQTIAASPDIDATDARKGKSFVQKKSDYPFMKSRMRGLKCSCEQTRTS